MRLIAALLFFYITTSTAVAENKTAKDHFDSGMKSYVCDNDYDKAIVDFNEAIRLDPNYAEAYSTRGYIWLLKDDYDNAFADFNKAIQLDPKDAAGYCLRGISWHSKGDYDKAIADYNEAIRLDPKDASTYIFRAKVWFDKKDYDKAIADNNEVILLEPKGGYGNRGLAWLMATCPEAKYRNGGEAVRHARRAVELLGQEEGDLLDILAAAYAESGDFEQAIKWQTKAIELAAEDDKTEYRSRLELYKQGKPYRAEVKK